MSKQARRIKAFRRRLEAIHRNYKPMFKRGDILVARNGKDISIEIVDIVGDQYKYIGIGEDLPLYDFLECIETQYRKKEYDK